jgi:hypothetical protein
MIEPLRADARITVFPDATAIEGMAIGAAHPQPSAAEFCESVREHTAAPHLPTRTKTKRPLPRPNATLLALAVSSLAFMAVLGLRDEAVRAVPPLARAYAAIGLPVNLRGLEIRGLRSSLLQDASGSVLAVEGEIVNVRPRMVAVPQVRIGIEGADGHEIYTWTTAAPKARLAEGETIDFRARLTTPPAGAHAVLVKFAALP